MNTPIKWNTSPSGMIFALARPRWAEVRQGLTLVQAGLLFLLTVAAPGLLLTRLAFRESPLVSAAGLSAADVAQLGWLLAGLGGVLACGLLLAGQWRCLSYAPQGQGAKEILFACLLCSLTVPLCLVAGYCLDGADGPAPFRAADVLRLAGMLLGLLSVVLFNAFLRAVGRSLDGARRGRAVACHLSFVGFLLGGSAGVLVAPGQSFHGDARLVLGLGWFLCLVWHLLLIRAASRCVVRALHAKGRLSGPARALPPGRSQTPFGNEGQVELQVAALFRKREG